MFTNDLIFGFVVFAGAVVVNRLLSERALKQLSAEEKVRLLDSFSGNRVFYVIAMLILILAFFVGSKVWPELGATIVRAFVIVLALMSIGNGVFSYMKLKSLSAPKSYVSSFLVRSLVYYGALLLLLFTITLKSFPR
jgi:hypothetical protein